MISSQQLQFQYPQYNYQSDNQGQQLEIDFLSLSQQYVNELQANMNKQLLEFMDRMRQLHFDCQKKLTQNNRLINNNHLGYNNLPNFQKSQQVRDQSISIFNQNDLHPVQHSYDLSQATQSLPFNFNHQDNKQSSMTQMMKSNNGIIENDMVELEREDNRYKQVQENSSFQNGLMMSTNITGNSLNHQNQILSNMSLRGESKKHLHHSEEKTKKTKKAQKNQINFRQGFDQEYKSNTRLFEKESAFKNQIKGFISKYLSRLKQKLEVEEEKQEIPCELSFFNILIESMQGASKKLDLYLLINKFDTSITSEQYDNILNKPVVPSNDASAKSIHNSINRESQEEDDEFQGSDCTSYESIVDDEKEYEQERQAIRNKEIMIIESFKKRYNNRIEAYNLIQKSNVIFEDYSNYDGYMRLIKKLNDLNEFFRKDIFKYLQSYQYITLSFFKKADKFQQLYARSLIYSILRNPKVLI